ncbi:cytosolic sulfotransferase 15-like [Humulus lupulus]|uniref:cytosolic sulfotransferase 15-like n=1 Tax=Humulus lupulus TaxID=3486 RepID=UPI002B411C1B|nr:cytosolic sulfotransferase 15-like [Humulus lupulus]
MEISNVTEKNKEEEMERDERVDETLAKLKKVKDPVRDIYRCCYQGFWTPTSSLKSIISFQTQFEARDDDILLASCPKSGFWKESLESPHKILFLKYEDLKRDNIFFIKKIADFLGYPFSIEEENQGVPQQIVQLCSFENLKILDVNKTGRRQIGLSNSALFRKGEVGDWVNYLTLQMAERGKKLIQEKLGQSNLMFDF